MIIIPNKANRDPKICYLAIEILSNILVKKRVVIIEAPPIMLFIEPFIKLIAIILENEPHKSHNVGKMKINLFFNNIFPSNSASYFLF
jgi:hypothetical protein